MGGARGGVPCTVIVPDHAPQTKLDAIERLGGSVREGARSTSGGTRSGATEEGVEGLFVHPVADERVMAGNGTIGLEIVEDLPDPDAVLIPFGGGGLIDRDRERAQALAPKTKVYRGRARDGRAARRLARSGRAAGDRVHAVVRRRRRRADACCRRCGRACARSSTARLTASLDEVAGAIRLLAERARVIAEGAGALGVAAALPAARARGRSSASSRAGTSTSRR